MKKIKRITAALCMAAALLALPACSSSQSSQTPTLDLNTSSQVCIASENLISYVASIPAEDVDSMIDSAEHSHNHMLTEAFTSLKNMLPDTGAFVGVESSVADREDNEYVCDIVAQFEERQVDCQVYFDMESGQATSISFAPRYTTGERMERAALNTVIGMGTVFIVLIFISLLIYCFRFINIFENKMKKSEKPAEEAPAPAAVPVEEPAEDLTDDRELVAVITAAIAASEGVPADGLVVRSIKRAPASKWKRV